MNRQKAIHLGIRIILIICGFVGMFMASGIALLGMGLMNLVLVILSFDELFVESPFNQTSIANIENNLQPIIQGGMVFFMVGVLIMVTCAFLILYVLFVDLEKKEELNKE